ncbi:MAG: ShlB/FhaC/HecB family hemolysin secretion/activation protein [Burkholderiales bacterium]|nr:MAG: ShlB/FhaC/HecB family hemolysin secretion/activation protein [Burkholderiales bacterium]
MFQRGDTIGGSFQVAPENPDDSLVYSGYYLSRINEHLSLMLQASKQDSDVATLGGSSATIGKGETFGIRALFDLPSTATFYQNFTLGLDWKKLDEITYFFGNTSIDITAPIEYFPLSASYAATRVGKGDFTEFNLTATLGLRGLGDDYASYENKRYKANGNFFHLRGDVSHTHDLKNGAQLFGKLQGQLANGVLINSEQLSGGGLGSARGYLEASALGDNGLFATLEYRTPSFIGAEDKDGKRANEWRIHAFLDGGVLGIYDALPGQESTTTFASAGFGTRVKFKEHFNGSIDLAFPLLDQATTDAFDPFLSFRGWADF